MKIPEIFIRVISAFIPGRERRRDFRRKFLTRAKYTRRLVGEDNIVVCPDGFRLNCFVYGTGNRIQIEETNPSWNTQLDVCIGLPECPADNCTLKIGRNFFSNGTVIQICEDGTTVTIGDDCMFSADVQMWASDTHAVTDMSGECINLGRFIRIGDRVWIGYGTTVLKNTAIADDCICGCRSLVSGLFPSSNCVIAGNPGKVCKTGVKWSRQRPQAYVNSQGTERHD